jgi:CxxC motif-containing protein (DUF1111 family)
MGCAPVVEPEAVAEDRSDVPVAGLTAAQHDAFVRGDVLFERRFYPSEGVGPLYIRTSCGSCHAGDARGPGFVDTVSLVDATGEATDLPFGNVLRPLSVDGATPLLAPVDVPVDAPEGAAWLHARRVGPAVFGRGYIEAIAENDIVARAAQQQREGLVSGRVHWVRHRVDVAVVDQQPVHQLQPQQPAVGRFGLKASHATLDAFVAAAFVGDMGLTSPARASEASNPDAIADDRKSGTDIDDAMVGAVTDYTRMLDIPARPDDINNGDGAALFAQAGCTTCHVPSWNLPADHPIAAMAGTTAWLYTDVLLHDMGEALADGVRDGDLDNEERAQEREWRTAPLMGLRFFASYLHDGRATTLHDAVVAHASNGSEANPSVAAYQSLNEGDRTTLLRFLEQL